MTIQQIAETEILRLRNEKARLEKLIDDLPEGTLVSSRTRVGGKTYHKWYASTTSPESGKRIRRYIPRKKLKYARDLAHSQIYRKQIGEIDNELASLNAYLSKHRDFDVYEILVDDPELMDLLMKDSSSPLSSMAEEAAKWMKEDYEKNPYYPEALTVRAPNGTMVRSKSEAIIMMLLEKYGIAYRYECRLDVSGYTYYPDFTILHPITGEIIYWEHFGKVTDYGYVLDNIGKVKDYISYGIKPWNNLIMTFSNEKGGYDGKLIDAMIECWLL